MVLGVMTIIIVGKKIVASLAGVNLLSNTLSRYECWLYRYIHFMDIHCDTHL